MSKDAAEGLKLWGVKSWHVDGQDHVPHDSVDVMATGEQDALRKAARELGLKPHEWCFRNAPYELEAYESD